MSIAEHEVVVVGAGPVGLVVALRLATFGVPSLVIDASAHHVKQGSKACLIHGDALEILDTFGCADPIDAEGVTWSMARTYVRNREIRAHRFPSPIGYGPFVNISQHRIEQVLLEAAEAQPLVDVRWGTTLCELDQDAQGATLTVEGPEGVDHLRAGHVVACDGVRSTLRELTGVEWTGYTHGDRFLITDLKVQLDLAKERHFHYDPSFNPGRQLVMHPQPDDVWRIDWQLGPGVDIDAERQDGRFDQRVRDVIGDRPYEIDWVSTYRFHQRVVDRFRVGRVLFAGDAAHSLPPYGSRGMNSGIQDADNLAWKLAAVLRGTAPAALLDTYHDERHAAARENLRVTEATIKFMVPPSRGRRLVRRVLLGLSQYSASARDRVNSGSMTEPHVYQSSAIVQDNPDQPLLGAFAPDMAVDQGGVTTRLRRLAGQRFTVWCFGATTAEAVDLARAARDELDDVDVIAIGPDRVDETDVATARGLDPEVLARYGRGWWMVRPDRHLAATGHDPRDLVPALDRARAGSPSIVPARAGS